MDLFSTEHTSNSLPFDGEVYYYGKVLPDPDAREYLNRLLEEVPWKNDEAVIFGKRIITRRMVAWYGDQEYAYTYSNTTKTALPWTADLLALKQIAERMTGKTFNSCLLNLYHDGGEGMAWHSDDEKSLGRDTCIASMSFGAARKFSFKHKAGKQLVSLVLESGSLLIMQGKTQTYWLHSLPKTTRVNRPRVNLTFRTMI